MRKENHAFVFNTVHPIKESGETGGKSAYNRALRAVKK